MSEAVVLGDINIDILMSISAYPAPGGDALAERVVTRAGGSAANTAIVLAKLGAGVKMIGRVGADAWADLARRALDESGVDVSLVQRDEQAATGMFVIPITPDGERTMFGHRGANARTRREDVDAAVLDGARILHVSGYALLESPQRETAMQMIELAEQRGVPVSLDVGVLPASSMPDAIRRLLPRLSICVLGAEEARALTEIDGLSEAAAALAARGVQTVGLKLGAQGCLLADAAGVCRAPAFKVATVDTTGAGDAFSAGMVFSRLRNLPLMAAGILANALGGLATTVWGAGPALPGGAEAMRLLRNQLPDANEPVNRIADVLKEIGD